MKLLAVIEDKNKCLRAYLPAFMSPFRACMTRYCSVHDVPNLANTETYVCYHELESGSSEECKYVDMKKDDANIILLLESDILYEEPTLESGTIRQNVAVNDDGYLILTVSINVLFGLFGRKKITVGTTWEEFIGSYTQDQLLQAVVLMPYPAITVGVDGAATRGLTSCSILNDGNETVEITASSNTNGYLNDIAESEVHWGVSDADCYLEFGLEYKRPVAYTLDSLPGITAHFGSLDIPGIIDNPGFGRSLTDIVVDKDVSCAVKFDNCIPVVNGLMYMPVVNDDKMYIRSAAELFWQNTYQAVSNSDGDVVVTSGAVMFMDFSELVGDEGLSILKLADCSLVGARFNGKEYVITVKLPDAYYSKLRNGTMFTVIDGRLITFDKIRMYGRNTVSIHFNDTELRYMRERDMQLTDNVKFNEFAIRPIRTHLEWLQAQFLSGETIDESGINVLKQIESEESLNQNRSFFFFLPYGDIYINEYIVDDRLNYNGLITHGNVAGMLQSCNGKEIFEHVILSYMDNHILKHITGEKQDIVYGSDAHVLGYAPYNHLTMLAKHISDPLRQADVSLESVPYVDRRAPEAVVKNDNKFRLLDIVKLR